ncbi:insulin receptor substrate 1 [Bombina bombina]|uniref:insulin receptor substrate 1 n=1 Tax=Bombina bombina TaxID=8345 RepID=UPI00235AD1F5|nr:insulin receptor substrate 1 [Bombina bombina]
MEDVKKCGYLRKQKSMRRRFFVLRNSGPRGPARIEYYENEKKFRTAERIGGSRGMLNLEEVFGVNKRADAKRRFLLVLYTRDGGLAVSAEGEDEQEEWYQAILELQVQARSLSLPDASNLPGPAFKEVWQVSLRPRGLGQTRNLSGIYRLCLAERTLSLLRLRSDSPSVTLQLMNVRRCGHSDNYFFVEVGRSAVTGPGELWMQVEDSVVAQNMHETILEAMKSLSEEFRPRTKSQSLSSTPITVPSRRHHPNLPPPSQVGFSRRSRGEVATDSSPAPKSSLLHSEQGPLTPEVDEEEKRLQAESNHPLADYGSASSDEYGSSTSLFEPPASPPPSPGAGETNYISMIQRGKGFQVMDHTTAIIGSTEEVRRLPQFLNEENYAMMGRCEPRQETGYMPMLPGSRSQDYMPMTPNSISPPVPSEIAGYVMMSPLGSCSPEPERVSWPPSGEISAGSADSQTSDYMNMWPLSRSASSTPPLDACLFSGGAPSQVPVSYRSLPRSYKLDPVPTTRTSCSSSSDSLEEGRVGRNRRPLSVSVDNWRASTCPRNYRRPPSPGEYVSIRFRAPPQKTKEKEDIPPQEYIAMEIQSPSIPNGEYTEMFIGPATCVEPQIKLTSVPIPEKTLGITPKTESALRPTAETFWTVVSPEVMLGSNVKLPSGSSTEKALGPLEKALGTNAVVEDTDMRSIVSAVTGCSLHVGQDRTKLMKVDPSIRMRHCSDTFRQTPASSCNGNRTPAVEPGLNYIDLDLAKDGVHTNAVSAMPTLVQPAKPSQLGNTSCINTYASIDFQMSGELRRGSRDGTERQGTCLKDIAKSAFLESCK